jgi:beta-glucuronidase
VYLYATASAHLTDIAITTGLDASSGTVDYAYLGGRRQRRGASHLARRRGRRIRNRQRRQRHLIVPNAYHRAPRDGYLYDLEVQPVDVAGDFSTAITKVSSGARRSCLRGLCSGRNGQPRDSAFDGFTDDLPVPGLGQRIDRHDREGND